MSTTVGGFASKALARFGGTKPEPGLTQDQLVAQLRKMGLADLFIVSRAEADAEDPESLDFAISVAILGASGLTLALGLGAPFHLVESALRQIWDEVDRSSDPRALVLAACHATIRRLSDLEVPSEMIDKLRQVLYSST
jgi:hypothetical protein